MSTHILTERHIRKRVRSIICDNVVHVIIRHLVDAFVQYGNQLVVAAVPDIHFVIKAHGIYDVKLQRIRRVTVYK